MAVHVSLLPKMFFWACRRTCEMSSPLRQGCPPPLNQITVIHLRTSLQFGFTRKLQPIRTHVPPPRLITSRIYPTKPESDCPLLLYKPVPWKLQSPWEGDTEDEAETTLLGREGAEQADGRINDKNRCEDTEKKISLQNHTVQSSKSLSDMYYHNFGQSLQQCLFILTITFPPGVSFFSPCTYNKDTRMQNDLICCPRLRSQPFKRGS